MEYYRIRNWEKYQHYKDRNPSWIKLHYEILTSTDWILLSDKSRLLCIICMLAASKNDGKVPVNVSYLQRLGRLKRKPDIKPLIDCGFLEIMQADDSTVLAKCSPYRDIENIDRGYREKEETYRNTPRGVLKKTVDKKEIGFGMGILSMVSESSILEAKKKSPGWDIYNLAKVYNEGMGERGIPNNPDKAFPAWCELYTKGIPPQ